MSGISKYIGILFLSICSWTVSAQKMVKVKGSGYILTQQRKTAFFHSIEVSRNISVYIVPGTFQPLTVEADDNLFSYIKTVVRDQTLKVYIPDTVDIVKFTHLNILISMPEIVLLQARQSALIDAAPQLWKVPQVELKASTGSRIHLAIHTSDIKINATTSAIIELKGEARNLNADLKTAACLYGRNFKAEQADIKLSIGAKSEIEVNEKIEYNLSGNSKLIYRGNPQITKYYVNTGSKVIHHK